MATVSFGGTPFRTSGELPPVGAAAPDFRLVTTDLREVTLADFRGKRKIVSIVPSLDTSVCAAQTRAFNERAAGLPNTLVLTVSADLPFAQKRFCSAEGLEHVRLLSMMRGRRFAKDYGVLFTEGPFEGIAARAVVVLDADDRVIHTQLVPEIGREPDYDAVIASLAPR